MAQVLIPYYRTILSDTEQISLCEARRHFESGSITFIIPDGLEITHLLNPGESVECFPSEYFESIDGYNRLMTSSAFYERFLQYSSILIYQLDCLVFENGLEAWISKKYDYIAAPWFQRFDPDPSRGLWRVGNGGFSLRNVRSHLRVLNQLVIKGAVYPENGASPWASTIASDELGIYQKLSPRYQRLNPFAKWSPVEQELQRYPYNEDLFWSLEAPKFDSSFRVATAEEALPFAFEMNPSWCFEKNGNKLPFGCHAWARYDREFWEKILAWHNNHS